MPATQKITCDFDGKDLTENGGDGKTAASAYRLVMSPEHIPLAAGISATYAPPPMEGLHYFCGFDCIAGWAQRKKAEAVEAARAAAEAEKDKPADQE